MSKRNRKSWFTFTASPAKGSSSSRKFRPELLVLEGRIAPSGGHWISVGDPSVGHHGHHHHSDFGRHHHHSDFGNGNGGGGQTSTATISGSVVNSQNSTPVSGDIVTLTNGSVTLTAITDTSGNFS